MLAYLLTAALSILVIGSISADHEDDGSTASKAQTIQTKLSLLGNEFRKATKFRVGEPADQLVSYHGSLAHPGYERLEPSTPTRHECWSR